MHPWEVRPLEDALLLQDWVLRELCRPCDVPVEQKKSVEQVWFLPLLQDVKEQEDVLWLLRDTMEHHEERVLRTELLCSPSPVAQVTAHLWEPSLPCQVEPAA